MTAKAARKLLIVESPAKARTIKKYLGPEFEVKASVGHVRDLPVNNLGVDVEAGFEPTYVVSKGKEKVIADLKKAAAKAEEIYLGPDPDREGEAIAWHIQEALKGGHERREFHRVLFHEITREAVQKALEDPAPLNRARFESQQARRILDRLVGYNISPLLWDKVKRGLSAGRVQSVALRLIVDREREILAFKPQEYWSLTALVEGPEPPPFEAKLARIKNRKAELPDREAIDLVLAGLEGLPWEVAKINRRALKPKPSPPYITSTLQQDAFNRLGFPAAKTMTLAQQLYEGVDLGEEGAVGLITYMRTDSTRVAPQAQAQAREYIEKAFGEAYLPPRPPAYASPKRAQEAHEAVRPTSVFRDPGRMKRFLSKDQAALYELIWRRFTASQMAPALVDQTSVDIKAGDYLFRASGSIQRFDGFRRLLQTEDKDQTRLPELEEGQPVRPAKLDPKQHYTQPPPRFTDASLVKELEERGIGRPSTYAAILSTIQNKSYAERLKGKFKPTELGMVVTDLLVDSFPDLLNEKFTAQMELNLDQVEEGRKGWQETLAQFYGPFSRTLSQAQASMADLKRKGLPTDLRCPTCGEKMVIRLGKNGQFLACSAYPECRTTSDFTRDQEGRIIPETEEAADEKCPLCGQPMKVRSGRFGKFLACSAYPQCKGTRPLGGEDDRPPEEPTEIACDKCGAPMVIKTGRSGGRFLACSAYPECRNIKGLPTGVKCPRESCQGELVERASKRGKIFFGCSAYPKCDYVVWDRPVAEPCPKCGHPHLVRKELKSGPRLACPKRGCRYSRQIKE